MDPEFIARVVDPHFTALMAAEPVPAISYGVVLRGELVHARGVGSLDVRATRPPDEHSAFRIASMTKSFTAATVLLLRDRGVLRLDDPVAEHVPQLKGAAADSRVTIRHLLTMTAGFPTDDPWGDRQQDLAADDFDAFLDSGPWLAWRPGDTYEYSNLGYALLGRVIEAAAGVPYDQVVVEELLTPLGLLSTGFTENTVSDDRRARGYVYRDGNWVEEPFAPVGAFAPMGGLASTLHDLARWVGGFVEAEDDTDDRHPLAAASRREMQRSARVTDADVSYPAATGPGELRVRGYGFGLVEEFHPEGRTVGHSGGYPGFGSHMRWHPATGLGIVALGSRTYAPMTRVATAALRDLLRAASQPPQRLRPAPQSRPLEDVLAVVQQLLVAWDDELVAEWFADNVARDDPLPRRRAAFEAAAARGPLTIAPPVWPPDPREWDLPSAATWWFDAADGARVRVDALLSPHRPPRIQALTVTVVPPAPPAAVSAAKVALDQSRSVLALSDEARVGPVVAGDGTEEVVFRVVGGDQPAEVRVQLATGECAVRRLPRKADIR